MTVGLAAATVLVTTHWELMHCHEVPDECDRALRHYEELVEILKIKNAKVLSR